MQIIQEPGLPYKSRKRRLSLDLQNPVPISHITKLVLGILQGHEGINFLIILSQQTQECLYGVQREKSRANTTEE